MTPGSVTALGFCKYDKYHSVLRGKGPQPEACLMEAHLTMMVMGVPWSVREPMPSKERLSAAITTGELELAGSRSATCKSAPMWTS